jgi:cellulose synthase operon protein C
MLGGSLGGGFGEIDLPAVSGGGGAGLPAVSQGGAGLPSVSRGGVGLPAVSRGGVGLPAVAQGGVGLPSVSHGGVGLPSVSQGGIGLPTVSGAGLPAPAHAGLPVAQHMGLPMNPVAGLPTVANTLPTVANTLPQVAQHQTHLPSPVADERLLPTQKASGDFGEIDLFGGNAPPPAPQLGGTPDFFGELDLPGGSGGEADFGLGLSLSSPPPSGSQAPAFGAQPSYPPPSAVPSSPPGNVGYGEVDLGSFDGPSAGGGISLDAVGPARPSVPPGGPVEVSLPSKPPAELKPRTYEAPKPRILPKLLLVVGILLIIGGGALQLTPVGAYGHIAIMDVVRAKEYANMAAAESEAGKQRLADDTFLSARAYADELAQKHEQKPRARELTAYAAYVEYMHELRFGTDAGRSTRAQAWLKELNPKANLPYQALAEAARAALAGDIAGARNLAVQGSGGGTRGTDAALLLGEIELRAKNWPAAQAAFRSAGGGPRADFGRARALWAGRSPTEARQAAVAVLGVSKQHAGAFSLLGMLDFEDGQIEQAQKDADTVIDGPGKTTASPKERSLAFAVRGFTMFRGAKPGDARVAFDEAIRLDPQNITALVGQGEALYADARYTEALSRFETAAQLEPQHVDAVVGVAKTKSHLDRTKEAREQLAALRQSQPKAMRAALWYGKVLAMMGERQAAEKEFVAALALVDPSKADAVEAYVDFAMFLAAQGRANEAEQKLLDAKKLLPPSAVLDRAIADVDATQGKYEEAVGHYQSALLKRPEELETRFRLGITYRKMAKFDLALTELDRVAAQDKEFPGLALERGLLFEQSGEEEHALVEFQGALAKAPNDLDLQLRVAAAYVAMGRTDDAVPMLEKLLKARNSSAEVQHYMGRAYLKMGGTQITSSLKYLRRAVELDPNRAEYYVYVAWAANESNPAQLTLARESVDKALAIDKLLADAYWQRGITNRREQAVEDAIRDLKRALQLKPTRFEAHAMLAECYEVKNQDTMALDEWRRALAINDKNPWWRYSYGRLLYERHDLKGAVPHLVYSAVEGQKQSTRPGWVYIAEFYAADALDKTGKKAESVDHYRLYLHQAPPNDPNRRDAIAALKRMNAPLEAP